MELTDGERALMLAEYLRSQDIQIEVNTILELKDIHYKLKIAALQAGPEQVDEEGRRILENYSGMAAMLCALGSMILTVNNPEFELRPRMS
jgi:hypothetical protein